MKPSPDSAFRQPSVHVLDRRDEEALRLFLRNHTESSMFLLGNSRAAGIEDHGRVLEGSYAAAFQDKAITSVAAHYWNDNLVLQAPVHAVTVSRAALAASGRPLKGILGPVTQVAEVIGNFDIDSAGVRVDETEKLFRLSLDELRVPKLLTSEHAVARLPRSSELDVLAEWRAAYEVELLGESYGEELLARTREGVERYHRDSRLWLLEFDGRIVSCSAFNTATEDAVQVGGVWTPPELRGRGFARSVVAGSLLGARADGFRVGVLFTGNQNYAAQRAYRSLGFSEHGDYRLVFLEQGLQP